MGTTNKSKTSRSTTGEDRLPTPITLPPEPIGNIPENLSKPGLLWWSEPPAILSYGAAVLSVAVALIIARLLDVHLVSAPVALFLCAIMFSAWYGGVRPGLLAVALSLLAFVYYFVPPIYSLSLPINEIPRVIIFLLSALFVGSLSSAQKSATQSLRIARDDLSRTVQELRRTNDALQAENAERQQAQEALHQAQADLAHVSRVTMMGELTASLAHEVNQPITAAITNANTCTRWLAGDTPNIQEARDAAIRSAKDGARAADIISRIRLLFKKGTPVREPVDINEVIREIVILLRSESARYSISVRTELETALPELIGDHVQLQQVFMNLVLNGIDAMKYVEAKRELIITSERWENEQVLVSVRDTGVGLPPQQADQIFDAFFTTKLHGTGMGLSISRSIVESHGGRLWADGDSARGASFHITLPTRVEAH
ncbi:MAG: multi-sensor signal transduction histidine kinase [Acidobacteria bacterium]|nr:multi-sensor signal transduction histidine kinase [Acidobacteriota bacterium]